MFEPITIADVRRHLRNSPSNTRPHRYARVLRERFGWTDETFIRVFAFEQGTQEEIEQAWDAVTLKQPALQVAS